MPCSHLRNHLSTLLLSTLFLLTQGCFRPPYNEFEPHNYVVKPGVQGTVVGAAIGVAAGSVLIGTGVGAAVGLAIGLYKDSKSVILADLNKNDINFYHYGDSYMLLVPTDRYFLFNSARLNDLCYQGLTDIIRFLKFYPHSTFYIAGFTDDIGSTYHKNKLSQARAEAILTYLWANGIRARVLHAEGYGEKYPISPNRIIHGSAFNRRIEIQWVDRAPSSPPLRLYRYNK